MKTQNLVILAVILIVILIAAFAVARPIQPGTAAQPSAQDQGMTQAQTTTTPGGLTFSYADPYGLAVTQDQVLSKAVIPPCDPGFDYCIYRTGSTYDATNFESAGIAITQRKDLPSQQSCLTTQPAGYSGLQPHTVSNDGYVLSAFSPISGAAAGSSETGTEYRLWYGSTCYALRTRVAQSSFQNYPAGTKTEFTAADSAQVMSELQTILNGMTLPDGTQVQFPAA
jgi:hypothetical protein